MSRDELLEHTEPCEGCPTGIEFMRCWDGKLRCRNCVHRVAIENGWDTPPDLSGEPDPPNA